MKGLRTLLIVYACLAVVPQTFADAKLIGFDQAHAPGQWIVKLKNDQDAPRSLFQSAHLQPTYHFRSGPSYVVEAPKQNAEEVLQQLLKHPAVASIQANRIFRILKTPNDPSYNNQYHHTKIGSSAAWDVSTGSKNVVVAIIDTGLNYQHPDIAPNSWTNPGETGVDTQGKDRQTNGIDDDGNGYIDDVRGWDFVHDTNDPMDDHGHGTHCSGIIGAKGDNQTAVTGINWNVSVVGLKFIDGKTGEGDTIGATKAIEYATLMGFPITSNSWGSEVDSLPSEDEDDVLRDAIKAAADKGILFVAAAGNDRSNNDDRPTLPTGYALDNMLSVAATGTSDRLASYSNYGALTVDLAAPGTNILSTVLGSDTQKFSGTSMAAPMVAGAAALLKSVHTDWNAAELKGHLLETVDKVSSLQGRVRSGGRINLGKALAN